MIVVLVFSTALLALIGALIYALWSTVKRDNRRSVDEARTAPGGKSYHWKYVAPTRNSSGKSEISIDAGASFDFSLEHESKGHRFAEMLGFTRKWQTDDPDFDQEIYIASDDPEFYDRLHASADMRRAALNIFLQGANSISARSGRLVVSLRRISPLPDDETAEAVVKNLNDIKRLLPQPEMLGDAPVLHPNALRAKIFNNAVWGSFILGCMASFALIVQPTFVVSQLRLLVLAAGAGLVVIFVTLAVINILFRGSSLGYDVLKNFLARGVAGIAICSYAGLYFINETYDSSTVGIHDQAIVDKYITYGRHNSTYYHLRLVDWHAPGSSYSFVVNSSTYNQARAGRDMLRLFIHSGYFDCEWIEKYQLVQP
jgi:hypothetical protein